MMVSIFNYIFFRAFKFFKAQDDNIADTKGSLVLSLMQFLTLLDSMIMLEFIYEFPFPSKFGFFLPLIIVLSGINRYIYVNEKKIEELENKWKNEGNERSRTNGRFIIIYLIILVLIPLIIGGLK